MDKRINKKGQVTLFFLMALVTIFLTLLVIIIIGIVSTNINSALDIDIDLGQVNLQEYNSLTYGKYNEMVVNNADFWGLSLIIGMVLGLWGGAYFTRGRYPKLGVLIDIGIIFIAFLISLYLTSVYSSIVTALSSAGQNFAVEHLTGTNYFMLNLPIFVAIIGVIMMIIFHSSLPPKPEELNTNMDVVTG